MKCKASRLAALCAKAGCEINLKSMLVMMAAREICQSKQNLSYVDL